MKTSLQTLMIPALAGLLVATSPVSGENVLFEDNFDGENPPTNTQVLNFTGFANFEVTSGGVDLIGNGQNDFLPGNGLFLDLAGSDGLGGGTLAFSGDLGSATGPVEVAFDLAGSQRDDSNAISVVLNGITEEFQLDGDADFSTFTLQTDITDGFELAFVQGGSNGSGALLDNIVITSLAVVGADDDDSFDDGFGGGGSVADGGSDLGASVIPTPGAAAAGLLLLGGVAGRRRRGA